MGPSVLINALWYKRSFPNYAKEALTRFDATKRF